MDVAELLFQAASYKPVLEHAAPGTPTRIKALLELERYDEAVVEAEAALARNPKSSELGALLASASYCIGRRMTELEPLNRRAAAQGSPLAVVNYAYLAIVTEDFASAEALLKEVPETGDSHVAHLKRMTAMQAAAYAGDRTRFLLRRAELEHWLTQNPSVHRFLWARLWAARCSLQVGMRAEAEQAWNEARPAIDPQAMPRLHRQAAVVRAWLDNPASRLRLCTPGSRSDAWNPPLGAMSDSLPAALEALARKPTLGLMFRHIRRAGQGGINREALVRAVWSVPYDPMRHDERLYKAIARLRQALDQASGAALRLIGVGDRYVIEG